MDSMVTMLFHAGVYDPARDQTHWSRQTRRSLEAARREAIRMASRLQRSQPIVEGWDQSHGLRPGDCDVVSFFESYDGSWRPV